MVMLHRWRSVAQCGHVGVRRDPGPQRRRRTDEPAGLGRGARGMMRGERRRVDRAAREHDSDEDSHIFIAHEPGWRWLACMRSSFCSAAMSSGLDGVNTIFVPVGTSSTTAVDLVPIIIPIAPSGPDF